MRGKRLHLRDWLGFANPLLSTLKREAMKALIALSKRLLALAVFILLSLKRILKALNMLIAFLQPFVSFIIKIILR